MLHTNNEGQTRYTVLTELFVPFTPHSDRSTGTLLRQPEPRLSCALYPPVASELLRVASCARAASLLRQNQSCATLFVWCCSVGEAGGELRRVSTADGHVPCPALPTSAPPRIASCTSRCASSSSQSSSPPRPAYCRVARRAVRSPVVPIDQRRFGKALILPPQMMPVSSPSPLNSSIVGSVIGSIRCSDGKWLQAPRPPPSSESDKGIPVPRPRFLCSTQVLVVVCWWVEWSKLELESGGFVPSHVWLLLMRSLLVARAVSSVNACGVVC
jgi:hypothetical protein